jgi:hypothetical protein
MTSDRDAARLVFQRESEPSEYERLVSTLSARVAARRSLAYDRRAPAAAYSVRRWQRPRGCGIARRPGTRAKSLLADVVTASAMRRARELEALGFLQITLAVTETTPRTDASPWPPEITSRRGS